MTGIRTGARPATTMNDSGVIAIAIAIDMGIVIGIGCVERVRQ
jgi:hypothetical protein